MLTSQPLVRMPSQLRKPVLQLMLQEPPAQVGVEFGRVGHTRPHPPQLDTLVTKFVSQPLAVLPSQLPKPALHPTIPQVPFEQLSMAFGRLQTRPHAPQLLGLVFVLVSQPLVGLPSQFAKGELHETITQLPLTQATTALGRWQKTSHMPQLFISVCKFLSQPSSNSWLQSEYPGLQVNWHTPFMHVTVVFGGVGQVTLHPPQLPGVFRFTSQPLAGFKSQFANPTLHVPIWHMPFTQMAVALARLQTLLQAPQ